MSGTRRRRDDANIPLIRGRRRTSATRRSRRRSARRSRRANPRLAAWGWSMRATAVNNRLPLTETTGAENRKSGQLPGGGKSWLAGMHPNTPGRQTVRLPRRCPSTTGRTSPWPRGLIEEVDDLVVMNKQGRPAWDVRPYRVMTDGDAPDEVNPSMWRFSRLTSRPGLYQVAEGIFQVRHFNISHVSFIEGDCGVVVVDSLVSQETAAAALALYRKHRGERLVTAVITSHSHVDHYGGVLAVATREQVASGQVPVIAPEHMVREVVSENLYAGTAMARRSRDMYGVLLPKSPTGHTTLQINVSVGTAGLIAPTDEVTSTGEERTVDGIRFLFQMVPYTEAPAEFNIFLSDRRALFISEMANATLQQIYILRGAQVRDAKLWARRLREVIDLCGYRPLRTVRTVEPQDVARAIVRTLQRPSSTCSFPRTGASEPSPCNHPPPQLRGHAADAEGRPGPDQHRPLGPSSVRGSSHRAQWGDDSRGRSNADRAITGAMPSVQRSRAGLRVSAGTVPINRRS